VLSLANPCEVEEKLKKLKVGLNTDRGELVTVCPFIFPQCVAANARVNA